MEEVWKLIRGSDRHEVSNLGNVRRKDCYITACNSSGKPYSIHLKEMKMKQSETWDGYLSVGVYYVDKHKSYDRFVHRLVAEQFLSTWDSNLQVNHINGDKHDNRVENLEMVTCQENIDHFHTHPLMEDKRRINKIRHSVASKEVMSRPDVKRRESEKQGRHVLCIEDNIAFSSRSVCAKYYGVGYDLIFYRCESSNSKRTLKLHDKSFKYMSEAEYQQFKDNKAGKVVTYV